MSPDVSRHARVSRIAVASALAAGLVAVGWQGTGAAAEPESSCPRTVLDAEFPAVASDAEASSLAKSCGFPVEVLDGASARTEVMALPDGTFRLSASATETRALKGEEWRSIDTTLLTGSDGLLRPAVSGADVAFSPGGDGPFAVMRGAGAEFSLSWPHPLPQGVVAGDGITYAEVYKGVDLVVRATATGFSHVLVVKTPEAAANPSVREADYVIGGSAEVTTSGDGVVVAGPDGLLASAPPAVAWDSATGVARGLTSGASSTGEDTSSAVAPGATAVTAAVDVESGGGTLTVSPDPDLFDVGTYPIFVDPVYGNGESKWIPVNDTRPGESWTSGGDWPREIARVGDDYDVRGDVWRAHFEFNTKVLKGTRIIKTPSVDVVATHSGVCSGETVGLWQTNAISNNTPTWNGMKGTWLHGGALDTAVVKANENCSGQKNHGVKFTGGVGEQVKRHAAEGYDSITFGLRVPSESGGHWAKFDPDEMYLNVEYEYRPTSASAVKDSASPACVKQSPGPWTNRAAPYLLGKAIDRDGWVYVQFDMNGPGVPANFISASTKSDALRGWYPGPLVDGAFSWAVRGLDNAGAAEATPWSDRCWFQVDTVRPTLPVIERTSTGTPAVGEPVTLRLTSSDALSGLRGFHYGVGNEVKEQFVPSTGSVEVTVTPQVGRTVIYVWAQDEAQNYSTRVAFDILTGLPIEAASVGAWRLDGDEFDDSGNGHSFTRGSGITFQNDRNGKPTSALAFDEAGTGCARVSSDGPVVSTDAGFTVAGWARLSDTTKYHPIVTQSGVNSPAFYLQYAPTSSVDRWRFSLSTGDTETPTYVHLTADKPSVSGVWEHVAVTVDPVAGIMRMFVNGVPVNSQAFDFKPFLGTGDLLLGCGEAGTTLKSRMHGLIDHVGVWQGVLTDAAIARSMTELPAAVIGSWDLRDTAADSSPYARSLTIPDGKPFVEDPFGREKSAIALDGTWCASTAGPVLRTHESFSVAAWAKADATGRPMTVVSQSGQNRSASSLVRGADGRWSFTMTSADTVSATEVAATTPTADTGGWRHLVGVYDASARELRLYVDGSLQATASAPATVWSATGPFQLGCTDTLGADPGSHLTGAVSELRTWRGSLSAAEVAALHADRERVAEQARWWLNGPDSSEPTGLSDTSGNGNHLQVAGPYGWTYDRWDVMDGALALELAPGSCARTTGPVTATDSSFSVAGWVLLPDVSGSNTAVSQVGGNQSAYILGLSDGKWTFAMSSEDSASASWSSAVSASAPVAGVWTHIAGVFDVGRKTIQLYVNGQLQGEAAAPSTPWNATGSTHVGCSSIGPDGVPMSPLSGAVDDAMLWSGPVDPERILALAKLGSGSL